MRDKGHHYRRDLWWAVRLGVSDSADESHVTHGLLPQVSAHAPACGAPFIR